MVQNRNKVLNVIIVICILGICACACILGFHQIKKVQVQKQNSDISQIAHTKVVEEDEDVTAFEEVADTEDNVESTSFDKKDNEQKKDKDKKDTNKNSKELKKSQINFKELKKINSEIVAWIEIAGTIIDYPVLYSDDELYYTNHDAAGNYSSHGAIFFGACCDEEDEVLNRIIYGHHMKDGTMFASLMQYRDENYATEHQKIKLSWEDYEYTYKVISVFKADVSENNEDAFYYSEYLDRTKENFKYVKEQVKLREFFDMEEDWSEDDELLFLSTCEYSTRNGRLVVLAKRL